MRMYIRVDLQLIIMRTEVKSLLLALMLILCQIQQVKSETETFNFDTEVTRLMDIIINSLYTQKQIFMREVISNASDALDKIRFMSLTDPDILGDTKELEIRVKINEGQNYISVRDTGVGMTKSELIENLGTIAKSGTTNFLDALSGGNINLIGQFGVGFYSTFLAGSKVEVVSKNPKDDQYKWISEAASTFFVEKDVDGEPLGRGTEVRIYLKEDASEFLNQKRMENLIRKYSEFIDFPIYLEKTVEVEVKEDSDGELAGESTESAGESVEKSAEESAEKDKGSEDEIVITQATDEEEEEKEDTKTVKKTQLKWEQINTNKALWLRDEEDIYEEDYIDFYIALSKQSSPPLNWIHFDTEGEVVFTSILYIPSRVPHDFYGNYNTRQNQLKLYVRRVLIAEKHAELIPRYLGFIQGVIDSDDLPLNVNRQTLQQTKAFKVINQKITKKILDMISEIAKWEYVDEDEFQEDEDEDTEAEGEEVETKAEDEEAEAMTEEETEGVETKTEEGEETESEGKQAKPKKTAQEKKKQAKDLALKKNKWRFDKFYTEYGKAIKLGIIEDKTNRKKLASLSRWYSTRNIDELISFDQYIEKMKPIQDQIYYASGDYRRNLIKSPLVSGLVKKGYEVILCDDPIDEYVFGVLREYEDKNIVNVGKGDFKMPDDDEFDRKKQKFLTKKFEPLIAYTKKLLFEDVEKVIVSNRLTDEPCAVIADSYGHSSYMDKVQKASTFYGATDNPLQKFKKILQINPNHKVMQIILERINNEELSDQLEQLVTLLYETAAFDSGFTTNDPNTFVKRFYSIYSKALGVVNLQRKQIEIGDVQLESQDFKDNEQAWRIHPSEMEEGEAPE